MFKSVNHYQCSPLADSLLHRCESALNYASIFRDSDGSYSTRKFHLDCAYKRLRSQIELLYLTEFLLSFDEYVFLERGIKSYYKEQCKELANWVAMARGGDLDV